MAQQSISAAHYIVFILKRAWVVVGFTIIGVLIASMVTWLLIQPIFYSSARYYITKADLDIRYVSSNELDFMNMLIIDAQEMAGSTEFYKTIISKSGIDLDYQTFRSGVSFDVNPKSRFFHAGFKHADPDVAYKIAVVMAQMMPGETKSFLKIPDILVVDQPYRAQSPDSPKIALNMILGGISGFMAGLTLLLLALLLGKTIRFSGELNGLGIHVIGYQRKWSKRRIQTEMERIRHPLDYDPEIEQLMSIQMSLKKEVDPESPYRLLVLTLGHATNPQLLAARYAAYLAQSGSKTLLLEMDTNPQWLHTLFDETVAHKNPKLPVYRSNPERNPSLEFKFPSRRESFGNGLFGENGEFDSVIICCGRLSHLHAQYGLKGFADEALIVIPADHCTKREVVTNKYILEQNGIHVAGAVFVE